MYRAVPLGNNIPFVASTSRTIISAMQQLMPGDGCLRLPRHKEVQLSNSGTITNTNSIVVNSGSNDFAVPVEFINDGLVDVLNGATESIDTPLITGTGSMHISTGGDLVLNVGSIAATQTIAFTDATGLLTLGTAAIGGFDAEISGFQAGDKITVQTTAATTFSQHGSAVAAISNGITLGQLTFANATEASLALSTSGGLNDEILCFCAGTKIATPSGEMPVERLAVGDKVLNHRGEVRPITWIGVGRILATSGRPSAAKPVIIRKGAFAENVPDRDLRVTKGHSFLFDDVLIPVEFLINHRSILWDDRGQEVELYHIELDSHDILVANGAPAESYRDDGNRWLFQNINAGWHLAPREPYAPVMTGGEVVDRVWRELLGRAGPREWLPLTDEADLHLLVDGKRVDPIQHDVGQYVFRLSGRPRNVRLRSRSAAPQALGMARDNRSLGVAVRRLILAQARWQRVVEAKDTALVDGYHRYEAVNDLRWTNGDAAVPEMLFSTMSGAAMLRVELACGSWYLRNGAVGRAAQSAA
jgi:hypothetical protein